MSSVKMIWLISANQETGFRYGHVLHGRPYELAMGQLPPGLHKIVFWGSFQGFDCLFSFFYFYFLLLIDLFFAAFSRKFWNYFNSTSKTKTKSGILSSHGGLVR